MKNLFGICFLVFFVTKSFAQDPSWSFNVSDYQFSMTLTASLNVNGTALSSSNDKVAAFINGEVRGVSGLQYVARLDKYVSYLTVYANSNRETINFKIYDSATDKVIDIAKTINFSIDGNVGNTFQSLSLANPILNNEALFTSFSFDGIQEKSISIATNIIDILLPAETSLTNLVANFTQSNNANVYINNVAQITGNKAQDFTNPIQYQVLSEDESVLTTYTVNVSVEVIIDVKDLTVNIASASNIKINKNPIAVTITTSEEVVTLDYEDFVLENAAIQLLKKIDETNYSLNLIAISQGDFSIELPENKILSLNNLGNIASNKLTFTYDFTKPYLVSILRKTPLLEITNADELEFIATFSEPINTLLVSDFETVLGGVINLQKINDTSYTITISNIENYNGTVSVSLKNATTVKDLVGNPLRISKFKNY